MGNEINIVHWLHWLRIQKVEGTTHQESARLEKAVLQYSIDAIISIDKVVKCLKVTSLGLIGLNQICVAIRAILTFVSW